MKPLPIYLLIAGFSFVVGISSFFFIYSGNSSAQNSEVLPETSTTPNLVSNDSQEQFIVTGVFEFAKKPTKSFGNIKWISINNATPIGYGCGTSDGSPCQIDKSNLPRWQMQSPNGIIITDNKLYNWRAEKLTVNEVFFKTEIKDGISYELSGTFLQSGIFEDLKPKGIVLKARLKKMVNNQIIAEEDVEFLWRSWGDVNDETMELKSNSK
jgi:hypothetical protein